MRDDIANLVFPIFQHGLRLKARLLRGERPDIAAEQAALKGLLGSATQAHPWGSDGAPISHSVVEGMGRGPAAFLGIRYALTCWLDEIMIDSPWDAQWNEMKLEQSLYFSNLRFNKFWEQARLAESMPGSDALETFLLCVLLGFRGETADDPHRLREWVVNVQTRIAKSQSANQPSVPEGRMEANVPALPWADRYSIMVKVCTVGILMLVPIATMLLVMLLT